MSRKGDRGYDDDDEEAEMGEKLIAPADFDGPTSDRHCTDVLCTILIVCMWVAMTGVGIYAVENGDYRVVLNPLDYDGNICGTDFGKNFTEYPYLWYINNYGGGVCVKECPSLDNLTSDNNTDIRTMITYGGVWQADGAELSADFIEMGNYTGSEDAKFCSADDCFPGNDPVDSWGSQGVNYAFGYAYYAGDSYPVLSRCVMTLEASNQIKTLVHANSSLVALDEDHQFWHNLYADVWTAKAWILGFGFGVSLFVSFVYVFILRLPHLLHNVIWGSIFITVFMFLVAGSYAHAQANAWEDEDPPVHSERTITITRVGSYILFVLGILLVLIVFCLRKQIQLAVGCVKEAGRAITKMPLIFVVPFIQGTGFIIFMVVFVYYGAYLASLGEIKRQDIPLRNGVEIAVRLYEFDGFVENCGWYLLFCLFWTGNFIVAVGDMVVAMAVAKWYFTREKRKINSWTVISSFVDTLYYHLGTCAYGSLILAIIKLIRVILKKIQKQVKKAKNKVADCLLCCCQCCLWCFEQCVKFLNKNAYIQTAIFGTSFCTSAREAFFLILRNASRIGAVSVVSGAVLIVGKLFISSVTTGLSYVAMNEYIGEDLYSIAGPTVIVFIISYFVSDMFMDVFDMGISTILQCFVADEEMFDGDNCYAEGSLQKWIDTYGD